ncbi:MAG TPA: hypothetical protein VGH55_06995 [Chthoniobacterales bacterium]
MKNRTQQSDPSDRKEVDVEVARLAQEKELKEKELNIQRDQLRWNRWGNPAFVAIVAGLIGYISTLYSSYSTRQLEAERQRNTERLEQENHESTLKLEREKQEGTLILEAIKTGGTAEYKEMRTAANLVFLADAGLISSIKKDELDRLRKIAGETLPSLPAPEPFEFKPSSTLTTDLQTKLTKALSNYQTYLATLGFAPKPLAEKIGVRVDERETYNASFDGKEIVLGLNLASDPEYVLFEYTWYVLKQSNPRAFQALWKQLRRPVLRSWPWPDVLLRLQLWERSICW